jgi:hypothetical protein
MTTIPKVTVGCMVRNEEKILPFFFSHYSGIADSFVIIDNDSTDKTESIVKSMCNSLGKNLVYVKTDCGYNDETLVKMKTLMQQNYFKTNADWFLIVDADEFIYTKNKDLITRLQTAYEEGFRYIKPVGYQMQADFFPSYTGIPMTDICVSGSRDLLFDKPGIVHKDLDWRPKLGCHYATGFVSGVYVDPKNETDILLLHYKFLGFEHRLERLRNLTNRLDSRGIELLKFGIGVHYTASDEGLLQEYEAAKINKIRVI